MNESMIILIGPVRAGKSVIAEALADRLGLAHVSLDEERWKYYAEIGYDEAEVSRIVKSDGMMALIRYWKPFEAHAVERVLDDHPGSVLDLGAGHSVYEDSELFAQVQRALAPYPNVILLLPSPDLDESVRILNERFAQLLSEEVGQVDPSLLDLNEHFVRNSSNRTLAKMVVYTNGQTPDETCEEILRNLRQQDPQA